MKQKDWVVVGVVAFVSAIVSFIISGKLLVTPANRHQQVEVVPAISDQFTQQDQPSKTYFNPKAYDPTITTTIGNNSNKAPFNGTGQ